MPGSCQGMLRMSGSCQGIIGMSRSFQGMLRMSGSCQGMIGMSGGILIHPQPVALGQPSIMVYRGVWRGEHPKG